MRILIVAMLLITATAAFAFGRATARTSVSEARTETREREIEGRIGDAFRFRSLALYCVSYVELDRSKLLCEHTSRRPRYQVVFERDTTLVGRIGYPGNQKAFPER